MKYLKNYRIFESNDTLLDDVDKFCKENLAYLIDMGMEIKVVQEYPIVVTIQSDKTIDYLKIKDDLIPFLQILKEKYIIDDEIVFMISNPSRDRNNPNYYKDYIPPVYTKVTDVINDKIEIDIIHCIVFYIINKK